MEEQEETPTPNEPPDQHRTDFQNGSRPTSTSQRSDPNQQQTVTSNNQRTDSSDPQPTLLHPRKLWAFLIEPRHSNAVVAIFTILLFATTFSYTIFAALQWTAMRETLSEMKRADRPWIAIEPKITGPLICDSEEGCQITLGFVLNNFGHSPASDALANVVVLADEYPDHTNLLTDQKELCNRIADSELTQRPDFPGRPAIPRTVFPGENPTAQAFFAIDESEIKRTLAFMAPGPQFITPVLIGCLVYRSMELPERHETAFVFRLNRYKPAPPYGPFAIDPMHDKTIPAAQLRLADIPGGRYAD